MRVIAMVLLTVLLAVPAQAQISTVRGDVSGAATVTLRGASLADVEVRDGDPAQCVDDGDVTCVIAPGQSIMVRGPFKPIVPPAGRCAPVAVATMTATGGTLITVAETATHCAYLPTVAR